MEQQKNDYHIYIFSIFWEKVLSEVGFEPTNPDIPVLAWRKNPATGVIIIITHTGQEACL